MVETGTFEVVTAARVPPDRSNLLVRAFERLAPADAFRFVVRSEIPLCGGLGSSAAAVVAGLAAADHLFELDADLFALATELEGHPDNVGAALRGGFVICDGPDVRAVPAPDELEAVLVVPSEAVRTADARAALPELVPIADAVANVASAATLTLGLATSDWDLISAGLRDRLHQPYRAHLYPRSAALLEPRAVAGRARGDDLRRRADRARLVPRRPDRPGDARAGRRVRGLGGAAARAVHRRRPRGQLAELSGRRRGAGRRRLRRV